MREREELVGIYPRSFQHLARGPVYLIDGVDIKNIALLLLDGHDQHVGRAEHTPILLVELDIGMARRVEVEEVGVDPHLPRLPAEKDGHEGEHNENRPAKVE